MLSFDLVDRNCSFEIVHSGDCYILIYPADIPLCSILTTVNQVLDKYPESSPDILPEPDDEAKQRSALLLQHIESACAQHGGWIPFSDYMNMALYQPGLGYYSGGLQKFGEKGDFITAPEVSPLFGQCLANQLDEILRNMSSSSEAIRILEFGAGTGVLAADILRRLQLLDNLPERYYILELSAELQHRQKQTIEEAVPELSDRVQWLNELPDEMGDVVVIANEVLDAMPAELFEIGAEGVNTLMVGVEDGGLVSRYAAADDRTAEAIERIRQRSDIEFRPGYRSEYNPAIRGWLSSLAAKSERLVVLIIDYGYNETEYYHPDRTAGTMMCYYRQRAHDDAFWWPGLQDITAFVNFTDVAYAADSLSMGVAGYTTQAAFLLANGLSELHAEQVNDDVQQQVILSQQIKTLTLPTEMGDRFKVMALTINYDEPLKGFSMLDLRNRL
jgi:SAM-dependent MidA family methyltransferase